MPLRCSQVTEENPDIEFGVDRTDILPVTTLPYYYDVNTASNLYQNRVLNDRLNKRNQNTLKQQFWLRFNNEKQQRFNIDTRIKQERWLRYPEGIYRLICVLANSILIIWTWNAAYVSSPHVLPQVFLFYETLMLAVW